MPKPIRSLDNLQKHCKIIPWTGCWIWQRSTFDSGYGQVSVAGKNWRTHRYAWTLANGPIPRGMSVLHRCDTPDCINPQHLWLGTSAENNSDRASKGRNGSEKIAGSNHYLAKLSEDSVRKIRDGEFDHLLQREIAERFGVTQTLISQIKRGIIWKHI